ncbi:cystathionine gamma-lyase [Leisingera sp. McT4-56]|uniref:cystathionine gamma-lyase n=1 Tax=Leisingera sp. McT4-56 TaxID=2881255 RepID=UPI001CF8BE69|nr:cystathionine gamma-lyase [Leisingera sp. McT4-56]MCB4456998.1 cystathionine gamma-lyase [Leisingera sp. McT4-56]
MDKPTAPKSGAMLHLRGNTLSEGDPVALPLTQSSMYHLPGDWTGGPSYGRVDNATWEQLEHVLGYLEDAPALAYPSGMAAISAALFATVKAGSKLLIPSDGYYVTRRLSERFLQNLGVEVHQRPTTGFADGGFDGFDVVFAETPSNPGLDLCDLRAIAEAVHAAGGLLIVDNTTMTPLGQRPLELGADVVVASDTKAPGGHSDVLMGHLATRNADVLQAAREWRQFGGGIPGPQEAWLAHRGLETLEVRFDRMCSTAEVLVERLAAHPLVQAIRFPGLKSDPSHELAKQQMARFGFLISITLDSAEQADAFINGCPLIRSATSFGGVHTSAERRARWGDAVAPGFIRISVGTEPAEELWSALATSLDALQG